MKVLTVYLQLYAKCFTDALKALSGRNLWTVLVPMALFVSFALLATLLSGLGMIGGLLISAVEAAIFSLYLSVLSDLVEKTPVSFRDLQGHVFKYFWSVINVMFVVWIAQLVAGYVIPARLFVVVLLVAFIAFNATPEVIYLRGTYGGPDTLRSALAFLQDNWIAWFIPNLLVIGAIVAVLIALPQMAYGGELIGQLILGVLAHVLFTFRGYLFQALAGTSHRSRMFAFRNR